MKRNLFTSIHWGIVFGLFGIAVFLSIPNFLNGIPDGHDLIYHWSRIMGSVELMEQGRRAVMLPGFYYDYGYPVPLFYPTGLLYVVITLVRMGVQLGLAYTVFIFMIHWLTASIFYLTTHRLTNHKIIRLIASFIYCLAPYRMFTDFYTRQALGEFIAFAFIPLAFYALFEILYYKAHKWPLLTLAMVGLAYTHTLSIMATIVYFVIIVIFASKQLFKEPKRLLSLIKAALMTLLLSTGYLLPMIQMLTRDQYQFQVPWTSSELNQLTAWNEVFYLEGFPALFPYGIHALTFAFVILGLFKYRKQKMKPEIFIFLLGLIVTTLMTTPLVPKEILSTISFLQFPWRLFIFVTYFLTILFVYVVDKMNIKQASLIAVIILTLLVQGHVQFTKEYYSKAEIYDELPHYAFMYAAAEFLPAKLDMRALMNRSFEKYIGTNNAIQIKYERNLAEYDIWYSGNTFDDTFLEIPVLYYIGYEVKLMSGEHTWILPMVESTNGLVQVSLPNVESGTVTIRYVGTWVQDTSRIVSFITWFGFMITVWLKRKEIVN